LVEVRGYVEISTSDARSKSGYRGAGEKTSCRPEDVHHCRGSWSPLRNFQWPNAAGGCSRVRAATFFRGSFRGHVCIHFKRCWFTTAPSLLIVNERWYSFAGCWRHPRMKQLRLFSIKSHEVISILKDLFEDMDRGPCLLNFTSFWLPTSEIRSLDQSSSYIEFLPSIISFYYDMYHDR
jgi:hypothetical protein